MCIADFTVLCLMHGFQFGDMTVGAVLLKILPHSIARILVKLGLISSINQFLEVAGTTTEGVCVE